MTEPTAGREPHPRVGPLLHITTAAPWRAALAVGSLVTPSLIGPEGFIHLSTPEQVHLPANRLYAGRDDLLLLVIDPGRVEDEIRWEPGVPSDPESMRFPHLYGSLATAAVTSVVPWTPGPNGFAPPRRLPDPADASARARAFDPSLAKRRAPWAREFAGGFAVRDPRVGASHEHNTVWLSAAATAQQIHTVADEQLAGCEHRRVVLDQPPPADLGWEIEEERLMVADPRRLDRPGGAVEVAAVTHEVMAPFWEAQWREVLADVSDAAIRQLIEREPIADVHLQVIDLAVLDDTGAPIASAQLRIDGATAALEAVMTRTDQQGRGLADAVVAEAAQRAAAVGCDLLWLAAAAEDWPREWYARRGFTDIGARWVVSRPER